MAILGKNTISGHIVAISSYVVFFMYGDRDTINVSGEINNGYIYCRSAQGGGGINYVRMCVYEIGEDDANSPIVATSNLIAVDHTKLEFAWRELTFPSTITLVKDKTYAVAVVIERGTGNALQISSDWTLNSHRTYNDDNLTPPTSLEGFSNVSNNVRMSAYLTYTHVVNPGGDINWAHTRLRG